ncbi:lipocalin family protein [Comamonas testosteroni]
MPMLLGFSATHAKRSLYSFVCGALMLAAPEIASAQATRAATAAPPAATTAPPSAVILELATRYSAERYMGLWYKVGKTEIPSNELRTRERYEMLLRYDGAVRVIYTYYLPLSNQWKRVEDYMEPLDKNGSTFPSGHRIDPPVTFRINRFGNLLSVDYRTFAIDANYQWALVKGPGTGSYFVLSRSPTIPEPLRRALTQLAKRNYPDMGSLVWSSLEGEK